MYHWNIGRSKAPWGGRRIKRCDKAFEDQRNDEGREGKGRGREYVKKRGTVCTTVVKVINLPCEAEWYLKLVFVGTMSIHCHLCVCVSVDCKFVWEETTGTDQWQV